MQAYKAFLYSERIVLRRFAKYVLPLLLIGILSAVMPYLNRFNPSGVRFPEEMAGRLAFPAIVFGVGLLSTTFTATSSAFEKTDGLHFFLFSSGIDKRMYLLAKLTLPIALSVLGAVAPLALYYGAGLYAAPLVPLPAALLAVLCTPILGTLSSVLCGQFLKRTEDIALTVVAAAAGIAVLCYFAAPWVYPAAFCAALAVLTALAFFGVLRALERREVKLQFTSPPRS